MSDAEILPIPPIVFELSIRAKGDPLSWRIEKDSVTIVFMDGRKLTFERTPEGIAEIPAPAARPTSKRKEK